MFLSHTQKAIKTVNFAPITKTLIPSNTQQLLFNSPELSTKKNFIKLAFSLFNFHCIQNQREGISPRAGVDKLFSNTIRAMQDSHKLDMLCPHKLNILISKSIFNLMCITCCVRRVRHERVYCHCIEINFSIKGKMKGVIRMDELRVDFLIWRLLGNGLKFFRSGSEVCRQWQHKMSSIQQLLSAVHRSRL